MVTIQNGLGSAEKVADILGETRVIQGVVGGFGASMKGPGHAHHNGMEFVRLGEYAGPKTENQASDTPTPGTREPRGGTIGPTFCRTSLPGVREGSKRSSVSFSPGARPTGSGGDR